MKTNYMIEIKNAIRKATWGIPKIDNLQNSEAPAGKLTHNNLQHKLEETVKGVQDFIKKYWLE